MPDKATQEIEHITIELKELQQILKHSRERALTAEEAKQLFAAVDTLGVVTHELESKKTSIKKLRQLIFGSQTEKLSKLTGNKDPEGEKKKAEAKSKLKKKRKKKGRGRRGRSAASEYTGADRKQVECTECTHAGPCPECQEGRVYRQKSPRRLVRIRGVAPISATVYELERYRCNLCGKVFTAKAPEGVGEDRYDHSAVAIMGILKYGTGMPFYRLEGLQKQLGIPLPASTQWERVLEAEQVVLFAVFAVLITLAAQGTVLYNDDTTMKILKLDKAEMEEAVASHQGGTQKGRKGRKRKGIYTTGIVSTGNGFQIALFFTGLKHAGENLADVLRHRADILEPPIQMCDGLAASTAGDYQATVANCVAHGRRKFVEVFAAFPDECEHVLSVLGQVYHIDDQCKEAGYDEQTRLAVHQRDSKPLLDKLREWMQTQLDDKLVEPNSTLGEALNYMLKRWDKLTLFTEVPGAPLDNNIAERALKRAILNRKNAMFYKTQNGARVGDTYMSLIYTCELHQVNPFDYLVALMANPEAVVDHPDKWLPWNYTEQLSTPAS